MSMIGGGVGGISGLKGTGLKAVTQQQFTPEQMNLFNNLFGRVGQGSFLDRLASGDESLFQQMEAPAMKQFGQLQSQLASQFSGMGLGGRRSSGFQNAANQQTADFAQSLQANRMGLQRQGIQDLMNMSNMLMGQRPFETSLVAKKKPLWQELLAGMSSGLGQGAGMAGGMWGLGGLGGMGKVAGLAGG